MSKGLITLEGRFRLEAFTPTRLYPVPEFEFIAPGGSRFTVPSTLASLLPELKHCKYIGPVGPKVDQKESPNIITDEGLLAVMRMLADFSSAYDNGVKYLEIGTGGGSAVDPDTDDTLLVGGAVRYAIGTASISGHEVSWPTSCPGTSSNIYIREVGLFMATTSGTVGAGDMLDHSSFDYNNSSLANNLIITGIVSIQRAVN